MRDLGATAGVAPPAAVAATRRSHLALTASNAQRLAVGTWVVAAVAAAFWFGTPTLQLAAEAQAIAVGAIGLSICYGLAGQLNLGQAALMGSGAYLGAHFVDTGWPYPLALIAAVAITALAGTAVAFVVRRLRNLQVAAATLGLVVLLGHLVASTEMFGRLDVVTMPPLRFGGWQPKRNNEIAGIVLTRTQIHYLATLALALVAIALFARLRRTDVGRRMAALRDGALTAEALGIDVGRTKLLVFALAGAFGAVGGIALSTVRGSITPSDYALHLSINLVVVLVIGGRVSALGSYVGALVVVLMPRFVAPLAGSVPFVVADGSRSGLTPEQLAEIVTALAVIALLIAEPHGLVALAQRLLSRLRRDRRGRPAGEQHSMEVLPR